MPPEQKMPLSAGTGQRSRQTSNRSTLSSGQRQRPKTVSESTPAKRVSSSYLREAAFLGRQPRVVFDGDRTQKPEVTVAWDDKRLNGGGPVKPPARALRKTNSSFSNVSAPPIIQNGRQREERGSKGNRITKSDNSLRRDRISDDDAFRTTNSAPAAGQGTQTVKPHRKPPPGPLPKLNNLVAKDIHGVTTATQSSRDHSSRHWASSWADAYSRNAASIPRSDTKISTRSRLTQGSCDTDEGRSEPRSPRRTTGKPVQRRPKRPVVITKNSIYQVKAVTSVYGNRVFKKQRHSRILKQLEEIELKDAVDYNQKLLEKEKTVVDSRKKQKAALRRLRTKFDEEQVQRFKTQYVTWKSVEHERQGRGAERYGLPETIDDDELTKLVSTKQKGVPKKKFKQPHTREQNIRRFHKLLNPKVGMETDGYYTIPSNALLEGIDTVDIWSPRSQGEAKPRRATVKNVLGSARKLLREPTDMDAISEASSFIDDSDNE